MIKVVIGKNDRVIATHPAGDTIDPGAYAGVIAKGEKVEVVTLPDDAVRMEEEKDALGVSVLFMKFVLVDGWREKVVTE